jgi:hypothetical protein
MTDSDFLCSSGSTMTKKFTGSYQVIKEELSVSQKWEIKLHISIT